MAIKTLRVFQEFTSAGYVPMPVAGNIDYGVTIAGTFPGTTPTTFQTDDPDIDVTLTATTDYYVWIRSHGTDWNPMYTRNVRVYPDSPLVNNVVMGIIIANLDNTVPYVGATENVNLGEFGLTAGYLGLDLTPTATPTVAGTMSWNDADGTANLILKGGNVTLQVGQEQVTRIVNKTGANLLEANYQAVRVSGAQGNRLKVDLAQANIDANSAETLGLVTETINNNAEGFITTSGLVRNIDTTGTLQGETWADGDMLYLSGTTAGRITNIKPQAPTHTVIMGYVVRAHQTQGQIYVKVDNGYELDELHNVKITSVANKNTLVYDSATSVWKNRNIFGTQGYVPYYDDTLLMKNSPIFTDGTQVIIGDDEEFSVGNKLSVVGNIAVHKDYGYHSGLYQILFRQDATGEFRIGTNAANDYTTFYANGTERVRISPSGFLGVGLTNPTSILHVKGTTAYTNAIIDNNSASGGGYYSAYQNGAEKAIFGVSGAWLLDNSSDAALIAKGVGQGIQFYTNGSTSEKMGINSDGNVFIGQTPTYVAGATQLVVRGKTGAGFVGVNHYDMSIKGFMNTFNSVFQVGTSTFHSLAFLVENIERGRVNSSGRLLWGTTTDNTTDLVQINGSLIATSIKKSGGTSSQFLKADGSVDSTTYGLGSVTSVGLSAPTGFSVSGSPITTSGTLGLSFASGYSLPSDATQATWTAKQNALNGTGFVKIVGTTISYDNSTYYLASNPSAYISGITSLMVTNALGYTPYNATNPSGYISGNQTITLSGDVSGSGATAITTTLATITQGATGSFVKITLDTKGRVTGNVAVGSSDITSALGYTPYNSTNPSGYISGITSLMVTNALGYTPYNSTNPAGYTTNLGTVTSVAMSVPTGLSISGSPITTSGTLALSLSAGYSIPTTSSQGTWDTAYNRSLTSIGVSGTTTKTLTLTKQDGTTLTASWSDINTDAVTSVFGRTGAIVATSGDYTTAQVTESGNLYYLDSRARASISGGTGISYNSTTGVITNTITQYTDALARASISGGTGISYNSTSGVITNTITQYTDALARASLSFVAGSGAYNSTTGVITIPTNTSQLTNGAGYITGITSLMVTNALGYTPVTNARQLTINGTTYDLSADRSWTISGTIGGLTSGVIPKASSSSTLIDSPISDSGSIIIASNRSFQTTGSGNYLRAGNYLWAGGSGGDYGSVGYNVGYTTTTNTYNYVFTDNASIVKFSQGGFQFLTAPSGIAGNAISFTQAMTLTSAGNLGIGNTNPTQKLQITQASSGFPTLGTPAAGALFISGDTNLFGLYVGLDSNTGKSYLQGMRNDSAVAYPIILNPVGGNVGIGTTSPGYKLDVNGTFNVSGATFFNGVNSLVGSSYFKSSSTLGFIVNDSTDTYNNFISYNNGNAYVRSNLGIGTTSPAHLLDVYGIGRVMDSLYVRSSVYQSAYFTSLRSNSGAQGILQLGNNDINYILAGNTGGGGYLAIRVNVSSESISSGSEAMRILANGNLLVGTTTDSGYKLDVNGTGRFASTWGATASNPFLIIERSGSAVSSAIGYDNVNTGMYFGTTTNHNLALRTNNTDVLVLANTGAATFSSSVNINGSSPLEALNVNGNIYLSGTANRYVRIQSATNYYYNLQSFNDDFRIVEAGTTPRLVITYPNGNVGIGTTTPSDKLTLNSSGTGTGFKIIGYQAENFISLNNVLSTSNRTYRLIAGITGVGYEGFSIFDTIANDTRFVIHNTGNIGINTTTDSGYKLDVNGTGRFSGGSALSTAIFSNTGPDGGIDVINSGTLAVNRTSQLRLANGTTYFGANDRSYQLVNIGTSSTAADFYIQYFNGSSYFDRFRITSTGAATFSGDLSVIKSGNALLRVQASTNTTPIADIELMRGTGTTWGADAYGDYRFRNSGGDLLIQYGDTGVTNTRLTVSSTGNLGLGVTPSAWSGVKALQIGNGSLVATGNFVAINSNSFFDGVDKYISNSFASQYYQLSGQHVWQTAPSGTAGTAISFTQAMTLSANGNLGIGTTTMSSGIPLSISAGSGLNTNIAFQQNSVNKWFIRNLDSSDDFSFFYVPSSAERMRITSGGNVLIGTTTDAGSKFQVSGSASFSSSVQLTGNGSYLSTTYGGVTTTNLFTTTTGAVLSVDGDWAIKFKYGGVSGTDMLSLASTGATFSSSVTSGGIMQAGSYFYNSFSTSGVYNAYFQNTSATGYGLFSQGGSSGRNAVTIKSYGGTDYLVIDGGTGAATFNSSITASSFFESSDKTIKTLLVDNYQTKGIESITAKLYTKHGKEELGYFAQDVQGILPSAVTMGTNGLLNLSYREVLVAKVPRTETEIDKLKSRVLELETQLNLR
jgi:hypothetical protein